MKKIFFVIVILSFLFVLILNNLKRESVDDLAFKCESKTAEEININQSEIFPYSQFLIKL